MAAHDAVAHFSQYCQNPKPTPILSLCVLTVIAAYLISMYVIYIPRIKKLTGYAVITGFRKRKTKGLRTKVGNYL